MKGIQDERKGTDGLTWLMIAAGEKLAGNYRKNSWKLSAATTVNLRWREEGGRGGVGGWGVGGGVVTKNMTLTQISSPGETGLFLSGFGT